MSVWGGSGSSRADKRHLDVMAGTMTGVRLYLWRAIQGHPTAVVDGEHGFDVLPRHEVVGLRAALRSGPTPRPMPLNETTAAGAQRGLHAYADFGPHDLAGGVIVSGPSSGASDSRTEAAAPSAATDFGYSIVVGRTPSLPGRVVDQRDPSAAADQIDTGQVGRGR